MTALRKESNVTPELLCELEALLLPDVPDGFFDDFTEAFSNELFLADPEAIPSASLLNGSVASDGADEARMKASAARIAYYKERRRTNEVKIPENFEV